MLNDSQNHPPANFDRHAHRANESEPVFAGGPEGYSRVVLAVGQVTGADRRPDPSCDPSHATVSVSSKFETPRPQRDVEGK
jgi:hypothetical protein